MKGFNKMITRYIFNAEAVELEYTDKFHGLIEYKTTEDGLRFDVYLVDNDNFDNRHHIGTIINSEYDIEDCHDYCENMLDDEDYCKSVWKNYKSKSNRSKPKKNKIRYNVTH